MPRKPQQQPDDGEPERVDISREHTGLLGNPASLTTLQEDMARQHDRDVQRLRGWQRQVRRWLDAMSPALDSAQRRLRWLHSESGLTRAERSERDELAGWLSAKQREIGEYEAALTALEDEIAQHEAAATRLREQKRPPQSADPDA